MDYYNFWDKEYDIDGIYKLKGFSRGSLRTGFILMPHKIFLDAGVPSFIKPNLVLITHGHQDHIDSLYNHLIDNKKIEVIANMNLLNFLQKYLDANKSLNCLENKKFNNWLPKPIIKQTRVTVNSIRINIEAVNLDHEVECFGYGLSEVRKKLKDIGQVEEVKIDCGCDGKIGSGCCTLYGIDGNTEIGIDCDTGHADRGTIKGQRITANNGIGTVVKNLCV
jgi:hypothetical protein